jgi:hypothetical protein
MKRMMVLGSALLLTTSSLARADESQKATSIPSDVVAPSAGAPADPMPPAPPPVVAEPAPPAPAVEYPAPPPWQPEPYTGWGRGTRAPIYVNMMLSVGALREDGGNRLTTRDSKLLEGFGGTFRVGAVLGKHHRIGARMQSFVRPTKKVLRDPPADSTTTEEWGAVTFGYIGPEYLYSTDLGLYLGGSIGVAGAVSSTKVDKGDDHDREHTERGSAGAAGLLSVGYEWRANKWFAMNAEVFGGLYHGIDDNENSMNGALFGLGLGMGF